MPDSLIVDQQNRLRALEVTESFIVQAPAGSGKTELLMQRFLALLAYAVEEPEAILAITFTNKAAREMKERILMALENAANPAPIEEHSKQTWQLARAVLDKDKTLQWHLLTYPSRLRIQTIDAFCLNLVEAMPIISRLGAHLTITTEANSYYVMAAENLLAHLETTSPLASSLKSLLHHLDNQQERVKHLFVAMLTIRDQWLPYLMNDFSSLLIHLERSLKYLVDERVTHLYQQRPTEIDALLCKMMSYFSKENTSAAFSLPTASIETWCDLAGRVLTKTGSIRQRLGAAQGFDLNYFNKEELKQFQEILENHPQWVTELAYIQQLPHANKQDPSYALLEELVILLPYLVAELTLIFQEENVIDFSTVAHHAALSLGTEEAPTDLAVSLDQRLQHILIDEFQDTSITQFRLLEKLTRDWQMGDGRTLFLVGDPMQSIYRFRQAEVGLFLRVKQQGLQQLQLTFLTLLANFRSCQAIVDWNNTTFKQLFPITEDIDRGAICYHPSIANKPTALEQSVIPLAFDKEQPQQQAEAIINIIRHIWTQDNTKSIGVLVKARTHLPQLLIKLNEAKLPYQAVEIEYLQNKETVQDLLSLSFALLNLADRLSWLALLRCPWFGLSLVDLTHLANAATPTLYAALTHAETLAQLSQDGYQRIAKRLPQLQKSLQTQGIMPFSLWIENTWQALDGHHLLADHQAWHDSQLFFTTLRQFDQAGIWPKPQQLKEKFISLYATPIDMEKSPLQVMTIHKAKGLEFDYVILPRLEASPPIEKKPLLTWLERTRNSREIDLLLAPIPAIDDSEAPLYDYIRRENKIKLNFENTRLLYVAATRAKQALYLLYGIAMDPETQRSAAKGSFLHELWPLLQHEVDYHRQAGALFLDQTAPTLSSKPTQSIQLRRFLVSSDEMDEIIIKQHPTTTAKFAFSVLNETVLQHIGTVLHRILYRLSQDTSRSLQAITPSYDKAYLQRQLNSLGVHTADLNAAVTTIKNALHSIQTDSRAAWILDSAHSEAHSEYALTAKDKDQYQQVIIDRTFIDEKGIRWIIDYKTTQPKAEETEAVFYDRMQQQYAAQLTHYAQLLATLDKRPIYLGLYFPLTKGWHSWCYRDCSGGNYEVK